MQSTGTYDPHVDPKH